MHRAARCGGTALSGSPRLLIVASFCNALDLLGFAPRARTAAAFRSFRRNRRRRYARGFAGRPWQGPRGVGGPHPPPPYPYAGTFSPYHHYPPMPRMGPGGGYGFPPPPFFSGFPPTAAGYPPHHVGAPSPFPHMFGSSAVPYGAAPAPAPGVAGGGAGAGQGAGPDQEVSCDTGRSGGDDGQRYEGKYKCSGNV